MPRTTKKPKPDPTPQPEPQPADVNGPPGEVLTLAEAAAYLRLPERDVIAAASSQGLPWVARNGGGPGTAAAPAARRVRRGRIRPLAWGARFEEDWPRRPAHRQHRPGEQSHARHP